MFFIRQTGKSLDKVAESNDTWFIAETETHLFHLVYEPDVSFLRGKESALHLDLAEKVKNFNKSAKTSLVFGPSKYIAQKELKKDYNIEFCQLPYAIHRIVGA